MSSTILSQFFKRRISAESAVCLLTCLHHQLIARAREKSKKKMHLPLDNLQSSLAVNTPEAEMVSLHMTSLKGFRGYPATEQEE